jgi:uncharacterized protein
MRHKAMPAPSPRTRVKRTPGKAAYDPATIAAILDAQPVVHVGYTLADGPYVTPTLGWRVDDTVFWHGSSASRFLRAVDGAAACLTATITDAFVLARSGFEHSVSYRSVMVLGTARLIRDPAEKTAALRAFFDRQWPGRWDALRPMTPQELKATAVLAMPLTEASAKISKGFATEVAGDERWPVWSGLLPMHTATGAPVPDPACAPVPAPDHVTGWAYGQPPQEASAR